MERYKRQIALFMDAAVATFAALSELTVGIALAVIGIISAVPEFLALRHVSGDFWLALAVAFTGVGSAHTAMRTRSGLMWGIFGLHLVVVEGMIYGYGGGVEMFAPIVTVVGASVMSLASQHVVSITKSDRAESEQRAFDIEQARLDADTKRQIALLDAEAKADAKRLKASQSSVARSASQPSHETVSQSSDTPDVKQQIEAIMRHLRDRGDTGPTDIGRSVGISRATVYRRYEDMEAAGLIHRNGNGVEVL